MGHKNMSRKDARDASVELLAQGLFVAAGLLVEDHQVGLEPVITPVGVRLEHLANEGDVLRFTDGDQGDRRVARDSIGP